MDYNERVRRLNKIDIVKELTVRERVNLQNTIQHFNLNKHGLDKVEEVEDTE